MRRLTNIATISTSLLAAALLATSAGTAEAAHRPRVDQPLNRSALRLEGATRELSYRAEHASHHASKRERRALRRFDDLQHEARDFRIALQRRGPFNSRTEREYGELVVAFERAERAMYNTHTRRVIRQDFREVQRRFNQLDRRLQFEVASSRPYRGSDRIRRAYPRYGISEIAYNGRIANADVRIRYVKREDDYDDRRHRHSRSQDGYRRPARYGDDDSSD